MHISDYETSTPDGENTLWKRDQPKFNEIRAKLLKFENSFTKKFSKEPSGTEIDISVGNHIDSKNYTQPTSKSCNLTSFLSVTDDLLKQYFEPEATVKEKFEYMINNLLTKQERTQLFKNGISLKELEEIATRTFETFQCAWKATSYSTPDTPIDQFASLLIDNKNSRCVVNFGASFLYGLSGSVGHCTHLDKIKIDKDNQIYAHLVEHANYKYPNNPWIPLPELYKAMSQLGTDGNQRGFLILAKKTT